MAGYTGEKRWRNGMNPLAPNSGVSELTKQVCTEMIGSLTNAEAAYAELLELYQFAGGTIQGLADLLFKEDIEARTTPGTNAILSVSITDGKLDSISIDNAGTGYVDGNYQLSNVVVEGAQGGAVINYTVVSGSVSSVTIVSEGNGYVDISSAIISNFPLAGEFLILRRMQTR